MIFRNKYLDGNILLLALVKWLASGFFSSEYVDRLFIPFVNLFADKGWQAYSLFEASFPYPPLTPVILLPFVKAAQWINIPFATNMLFHFPLLVADLGIFIYLIKLNPLKANRIKYLYFLSPVVFFASFMHGQLDLLPTFFIFSSSFYLIKDKKIRSFLLFGVSVAIKWHTIVALPFYFVYLYRREGFRKEWFKLLAAGMIPLTISLLPFMSWESIYQFFSVPEGRFLFETFFEVMNLKLLVFPLIYFSLLTFSISYPRLNGDLFLALMAIVFIMFVITVYPNPGWFVWFIPFLVHILVRSAHNKTEAGLIYGFLSMAFLVFFLFFYDHPFNSYANLKFLEHPASSPVQNSDFRDTSFTFLVCSLLIAMVFIYRTAIERSHLFKRRFEAFLIGIAGDSGAGKSQVLSSLKKALGESIVTTLEGDGEHKWERGHENWQVFTHLNPKANALHRQLSHLISLKRGEATTRSDYNHQSGIFTPKRTIHPNDFIALAGLHPFYLKAARDKYDIKIYLETQEELRQHWKILRDQKERKKSHEEVLAQIQSRAEDAQKYIHPQAKYADLIIRYKVSKQIEPGITQINTKDIHLEYEIDIDIPMELFLKRLSEVGIKILEHEYNDELTRQIIKLNCPDDFTSLVMQHDFSEPFEAFNIQNPVWETGINGLNQAVLLFCVFKKYMGIENEEI